MAYIYDQHANLEIKSIVGLHWGQHVDILLLVCEWISESFQFLDWDTEVFV